MIFEKAVFKRLVPLTSLILFLGACATTPKQTARPIPQDHFAEVQRPDIPMVMNDRVQDWMEYFQGKGRPHFERYLRRSGRYIPMMRRILKQNGLPEDLVYLSMIESGFNPHAYSRARATGAWQFIYQTGLRYGLSVNTWVDERRDPEKSTVAAAQYLKELYDRFKHWYLATASYNAGEGKIGRAIQMYNTEDFWELAEGRYLKTETKDYVPKLIAAAMLAKNPAKYGFKNIAYEVPVLFDEVTLTTPMDLRVAAKCAGVTYDEVKAMNPELLHWLTPPDAKSYSLKLPTGTQARFLQSYAGLTPEQRLGAQDKTTVEETTTVAKFARERGVPAVLLAAVNGMDEGGSFKPGKDIVLPMDPPEGATFYEKRKVEVAGRGRHRGRGGAIAYKVRKGDSLKTISRKTGVSVAALKKNNPEIDWSTIRKGQQLKLHTSRKKSSKIASKGRNRRNLAMRDKTRKSSGKGKAALRRTKIKPRS